MATKIRLQRHGRKSYAFYQIVVADSRAPRDGKFIERVGSFNPNTNPATIDLNFERALYWLQTGAQPTDTARNILSEKGVLIKKHLLEGAKKGAFTVEEAEKRFEAWVSKKESSMEGTKNKLSTAAQIATKERLEAEKKVNEAKAKAIAEKLAAKEAEEAAAKAVEEAPATEEAPAAEETVAEEAPAAE